MNAWEQYGVMGLTIFALFFILWHIVNWAKSYITDLAKQHSLYISELTKQHNEERASWARIMEQHVRTLEIHNQGSIEARKATEEAHRYQRDEHGKMLGNQAVICKCLEEVEKSLGRINGYVK